MGTSSLRLASLRLRWDHPHACGDKCGVPQLFYELRGSSPRVWGQVFDIFSAAIATGIIPTRVGTSKRYISEKLLFGDHPHACGDKSSITALVASSMGSSPRVWGQATERLFCRLLEGSSPRVWGQADITDCLHSHSGIIPTRVGTRAHAA